MSTVSQLVPLFVIIPLSAAFLNSILGSRARGLSELIRILSPLGLFLFALKALQAVNTHGIIVYCVGAWKPPFGISLVLDGLSVFMLVTMNLAASAISIYAVPYMERYTKKWKFSTLFLLMLAGVNGVVITGDIFNMLVFLEIAAVASFALVAFGTEKHELEAAFKYAVMSLVGTLFTLLAIALLYSFTSTLNMADMAVALLAKKDSPLVLMITMLLITGFGIKAALVPFHAWLPDAHPSAPAPISAMLSGVIIKSLGVYALCRILFNVIGMTPMVSHILMFLGVLSIMIGVILAIGQWDLKRLLAYSSISQIGYIFLGIGLATPLGILGGLFHLFNHSILKTMLFLNSGSIEYRTGTRDLVGMGGLMQRMPVTGTTHLLASLSLAGLPPLNGFWSKLIIIIAAVQAGRAGYALLAVLGSVLTMVAFMKMLRFSLFGPLPNAFAALQEVPLLMRIAVTTLAAVGLGAGILLIPGLQDQFLSPARDALWTGVQQSLLIIKSI